MPAPINPSAPGAMPPRERQLLQKFGLSSATLLTTDRQSPKLRHGQALARSVILYTLPARSLAEAINPDNPAGGPFIRARAVQPGRGPRLDAEGPRLQRMPMGHTSGWRRWRLPGMGRPCRHGVA